MRNSDLLTFGIALIVGISICRCSPISSIYALLGERMYFSYSALCSSNHSLELFAMMLLRNSSPSFGKPLNSITYPFIFVLDYNIKELLDFIPYRRLDMSSKNQEQ